MQSSENPLHDAPTNRLLPRPLKVKWDFMDARPTGFGGWPACGPSDPYPGIRGSGLWQHSGKALCREVRVDAVPAQQDRGFGSTRAKHYSGLMSVSDDIVAFQAERGA